VKQFSLTLTAFRLLALALASTFAGYGITSCPSDKAPESGPVRHGRQLRSQRTREAAVDQDSHGREWRPDSECSHSRGTHTVRRQPARNLPMAAVHFRTRPEFLASLAPLQPVAIASAAVTPFFARPPPLS
jgi:hypothetical protein